MILSYEDSNGRTRRTTFGVLMRLYHGRHPGAWLGLSEIARVLNTKTAEVKRLFREAGVRERTPKDWWAKIKWCGAQKYNSKHYSDLELIAKEVFEGYGLFPNFDYYHNFKVAGNASADFYFPRLGVIIEIDSVWHDEWWRTYDRGRADKKRDAKLECLGLRVFRVRFKNRVEAERLLKPIIEKVLNGGEKEDCAC